MSFVHPISWWLALLLAAAVGTLTYAEYRRPLTPLNGRQRALLAACRALALGLIVVFQLRPTIAAPPGGPRAAIVPVLVDRSRSMRLNDADGQVRLSRATSLLSDRLLPELAQRFTVELFGVGERVEPARLDRLTADAAGSDLRGALAEVRERYRGQHVAGVVLLSDGADTSSSSEEVLSGGPPVFAVGIGSAEGVHDREVVGIAAGDQRLDQTTIDLHVSAASSGFGRGPFQLRVLANGSELERRRVVPSAEGAPVDEVFTVSPDPARPTVFTAEIPAEESEPIPENNQRSALVNPAGRRRRVLVIEGAPGFEHSFMTRAWLRDASLEVDVVGRKGRNVEGHDTFFVQAAAARTASLGRGFPARREDLYQYDALVLANVDGDMFTQAQLTLMAEFVSERGGGLLVVGGRSFEQRGLRGTPLEGALPVDLSDRRGGLSRSEAPTLDASNKLMVTAEGAAHSLMRIGATAEETRRLWAGLPALASTAPLGEPRPGASVLAVAVAPTGVSSPLVAVERYGRGRSMIFSGEASWRWKMLLPSTDRRFDTFWRQAARWIAGPTPDPVAIMLPEAARPGEVAIAVDVRDQEFTAVGDAAISSTVTSPDGESRSLQWRPAENGRYLAYLQAHAPGLYRIGVEARRARSTLGSAERWLNVGGVDREFVEPRLNEEWLRRVAATTGGRYVRPADALRIAGWLRDANPQETSPERRELWHEPSAFALVIGLLAGEWILRRKWGLR